MRALLLLLLCIQSAQAHEETENSRVRRTLHWLEYHASDIKDAVADLAAWEKEFLDYGRAHHPFLTYFYLSLYYSVPMLASAYSKDFIQAIGMSGLSLGSALYLYNTIIAHKQKFQKHKNLLLQEAACTGDIEAVRNLLKKGVPATTTDNNNLAFPYTAPVHFWNQQVLHTALLHGNLDIAHLLWSRGANIDNANSSEAFPFVVTLANSIDLSMWSGKVPLESEKHKRLLSCLQWVAHNYEHFTPQEIATHLAYATGWMLSYNDIKGLLLLRKASAQYDESHCTAESILWPIALRPLIKADTFAYLIWEHAKKPKPWHIDATQDEIDDEKLKLLQSKHVPQLPEKIRTIVLQDRFEKQNFALALRNREIGKRK